MTIKPDEYQKLLDLYEEANGRPAITVEEKWLSTVAAKTAIA
jgi:hypothetical protein